MVDPDADAMDCTAWVTVNDDSMMSNLVSYLTDAAAFQLKEFNTALQKPKPGTTLSRLFNRSEQKEVRNVSLDQMLRHQLNPLPVPLLKSSAADHHGKALKAFTTILRFSEYPALTRDGAVELGRELLKIAFYSGELRDECYMQLLKQSRGNANVGSRNEVWRLTHLLSATTPPSREYVKVLIHHIRAVAISQTENAEVKKLVQKTGQALNKTVRFGPRNHFPPNDEIEGLMFDENRYVDVYFLDDTEEPVPYTLNTTVLEAVDKLADIVDLRSTQTFSLYECREKTDLGEMFLLLDDHRYIGDILLEQEREDSDRRFVFRKRMFREFDAKNKEAQFLTLSYIQVQYDYLHGYYPVVYEDAAQLCALQLAAELNNELPGEERSLDKAMKTYSTNDVRRPRAEWRADVVNKFYELQPLTIETARFAFLSIIRSFPYGNSIFFGVNRFQDPTGLVPPKLILGINHRGIHFFRPTPKEYLHSVELRDVMQFGSSERAVFLKMRFGGVINLFKFESRQGDDICMVIQTHINDLMVKQYTRKLTETPKPAARVQIETENVDELCKEMDRLAREYDEVIERNRRLVRDRNRQRTLLRDARLLEDAALHDRYQNETELTEIRLEVSRLKAELRGLKRNHEFESTRLEPSVRAVDGQTANEVDNVKEMERTLSRSLSATRRENADLRKDLARRESDRRLEVDALNNAAQEIDIDTRKRLRMEESRISCLRREVIEAKNRLHHAAEELLFLQENSLELTELRMTQIETGERNAVHSATIESQCRRIDLLEEQYKQEKLQRKQLHNTLEETKGAIRVYARVRSLQPSETTKNHSFVLDFPDAITVGHEWKRGQTRREYLFDKVFHPSATQADVFTDTHDLIQSALDGFNACIFAYGQTGSGKTYTIYGDRQQPGIAPRAINHLFRTISQHHDRMQFRVKVYMMELYQDVLLDLLAPRSQSPTDAATGSEMRRLEIKKDVGSQSIRVRGVTMIEVQSAAELMDVFYQGQRHRHVSATKLNIQSSRSHLITSVVIESTDHQTQEQSTGKLSFVDLAGSERVKKSRSTGEQLKEAQTINKSLSALGDVIMAIVRDDPHIPYRNHKLTMLMSDSLGGNAKALMFVNVSPSDADLEETQNSLQYAKRARSIKNGTRNGAEQEIMELKERLAFWKSMTATENKSRVEQMLKEFRF